MKPNTKTRNLTNSCSPNNFSGELLRLILIALAGCLAYSNSFSGAFVFDDQLRIADNPAIRDFGFLRNLFGQYRPVVHLTLALNYALSKLEVWSYHVFNLAIHILAALVLFGLVRRTLESRGKTRLAPTNASQNSHTALAFAIACLWVVHPLNTQAVTYIIQRSESLAGLFYLLTLYAVSRCVHSRGWKIAAVLSCALGMLTKETVVTAPVLALFYDRIFLSDSWKEILKKRFVFYAALFATGSLLAATLFQQDLSKIGESAGFGVKGIAPIAYALTQTHVIFHYLKLALWPTSLTLDYLWFPVKSVGETALPLAGILLLLAFTLIAFLKRPALGFLGLWFFVTLAPTSSFMPLSDLAFEHRMYLPLAAVIALSVVGVNSFLNRAGIKGRVVKGCFVLVPLMFFTTLTIKRNSDYRSDIAIWEDTVAKRPKNYRAHNNLGKSLANAGRLEEAIRRYETAIVLAPKFSDAYYNLGNALSARGKFAESVQNYKRSLEIKPDYAEAHNNLATALDKLGKHEEARLHYEEAARLEPERFQTLNNMGKTLADEGAFKEAAAYFEKALALNPASVEVHENLGLAYDRIGNAPAAGFHYQEAIRLGSARADTASNLGILLAGEGKRGEALEHFKKALALNPNFAEAHNNLGALLAEQGRFSEAAEHFKKALALKPDYADARKNLERVNQK